MPDQARLPLLLVCALALVITGCARLAKLAAPVTAAPPPSAPQAPVSPPPRWAPTNELITGEAADPPPPPAGPEFDVGNPEALNAQVKARCAAHSPNTDAATVLSDLAAGMLADGVEAGQVTDAMIRANCGGLGAIVRAVVASGGAAVVSPVVDRALFLGGPGAEPIVSAAVSAGLQRDLATAAPKARAGGLRYAMAYFPVAGSARVLAEAADLATLYDAARSGYGLYTFILAGAPDNAAALDTYRELLRVIETYVLFDNGGPALPIAETHVFLVPLRPERSGAELIAQTDPALSAPMREAFANNLREQGQGALAEAVMRGAGPFLVTTLAPSLVTPTREAPRLVVDLSSTGAAFAYAVIDAFDRPVPPELTGDATSLLPIQERLLAVLPAANGSPAGGFVHLLGAPVQANAPVAAEGAPPPLEGHKRPLQRAPDRPGSPQTGNNGDLQVTPAV